jgi:hypothetical protein
VTKEHKASIIRPYPPTMYCPCGSDKKYGRCCLPNRVKYFSKEGIFCGIEPVEGQPDDSAVIEAIKGLGYRLAPAELATECGLPLAVAIRTLNHLATDSGAIIEVGGAGEVVYQFKRDFESLCTYARLQRRLTHFTQAGIGATERALRFLWWLLLAISPLYWFTQIKIVPHQTKSNGSHFGIKIQRTNQMLAYDTFALVFGGNFSIHRHHQSKWHHLAEYIRQRGGVITIEEAAALLEINPKNESAILPVLLRFNGYPEVTGSGNLVYVFPELQLSADHHMLHKMEPVILEEKQPLLTWSDITSLFCALNVPSYALIWAICSVIVGYPFVPSLSVAFGHPLVCCYLYAMAVLTATLNLVPACRIFYNSKINHLIEKRNQRRRNYARQLCHPTEEFRIKLKEAEEYKRELKTIGIDKIIYRTDEDLLLQ